MNNNVKKRIIGSSVKPCIHDLGIRHFIKLLKSVDSSYAGFDLGVAEIDKIIGVIKEAKRPGLIVGISYRLGVAKLKETIEEFIQKIHKEKLDPRTIRSPNQQNQIYFRRHSSRSKSCSSNDRPTNQRGSFCQKRTKL